MILSLQMEKLYEGQPIAIIAAKCEPPARAAAACVKVSYEELKPIVSLDEAIAAKQFKVNNSIKSFPVENVESALKSSDAVVEGMIQTTRQEHFYEERNNCLVVPVGEDDEYKVYIPSPAILVTQHQIAAALGVSFSRVHVHTKKSFLVANLCAEKNNCIECLREPACNRCTSPSYSHVDGSPRPRKHQLLRVGCSRKPEDPVQKCVHDGS